MGVDEWSTNEAQNASLGNYDVSRGECPDASTSEHARELMANIKALSDSVDERFENFVGENIEVDGITIENNEGTLTVVDVAIGGDTEDLLTEKITEIEAAATQAGEDATAAQTAATQAAASAASAASAITSAATAANLAAEQADIAARAAARAQSGAAMAESAVQAVVAQTDLNWQKSGTAGAVAIYPVPETVLEPVVNFSFTETLPSGDKSPTNPSTITGVSSVSVTRCGKNFAKATDLSVQAGRGITASLNSDGSVHVSGTTTGEGFVYLGNSAGTEALLYGTETGKTYTFSLSTTYTNCSLQVYFSNSLSSWGSPKLEVAPNSSGQLTIASSYIRGFVRLTIPSGYSTDFDAYVQIEEGSTATTLEPYEGNDYTIQLGNTYYGGSLDISTGLMTVTWAGNVFTGEEDVTQIVLTDNLKRYRLSVSYIAATWLSCVSSHYPTFSNNGTTDGTCYMKVSGAAGVDFIDDSKNTVDDFKSFLATQYSNGTPVTLVYTLASPYTVQLTPTQILSLSQSDKYTPRCNTVYSDQTSVQVGYAKSPMQTEYELTQAILAVQGGE